MRSLRPAVKATDRVDGFVQVDGVALHYRSFGAPRHGTVLALSGGPGCSLDCLLPLADLVPSGYRVVLYDAVGVGSSATPRAARYYTQAHAVAEAEGIRRALRLGRVDLFGHSYGGALALDVALHHPRGLRSLIVSSGFSSNAEVDREVAMAVARLPRWARSVLAGPRAARAGREEVRRAMEPLRRARYNLLPYSPYDLWYTLETMPARVDRGRLAGWDITARLGEIDLPTLVLVGRRDIVSPRIARRLQRGIPGARLEIFPRSAHAAMWEERGRFGHAIASFLEDLGKNGEDGSIGGSGLGANGRGRRRRRGREAIRRPGSPSAEGSRDP